LTLVGFGTSTSELVANLRAALIGAPGIAIGNVVGSTIANILLILGLSAVLFPLATTKEAFRRDGGGADGRQRFDAGDLPARRDRARRGPAVPWLLAAYTVYNYLAERRTHHAAARMREAEAEDASRRP
jgi:cation:H+ antiporter